MKKKDQKIIANAAKRTVETQDAKNWYKGHFGSDDDEKKNSYWNAKSRSEDLAKAILEGDGIRRLKSIDPMPRENKDYFVKHKKETESGSEDTVSNRFEELIAMRMCKERDGNNFPGIGTIIYYQMPLKSKQADKGLGKIDLIAYTVSKKEIILKLLELKQPFNVNDTLLRSVLEIYTYSRIIDKEKLIAEFRQKYGFLNASQPIVIEPAVVLFDSCLAGNEYKNNEDSYTRKVMDALGVKYYKLGFSYTLTDENR